MLVVRVLKVFVLIERPVSICVIEGQERDGDGVRGTVLDFGLAQSFLWREWVVCLEQIPSSMPTSAALYLLAGETIKK